MGNLARNLFLSALFGLVFCSASEVKCNIESERIYCTYFSDRSDNASGKEIVFEWISPTSPRDDRVRHYELPAYRGSVYDYRFMPGRQKGVWHVRVTDRDTNESVQTTFTIPDQEGSFFDEDE